MSNKTSIALVLLSFSLVAGSALALSESPAGSCQLLNSFMQFKRAHHAELKRTLGLNAEQEVKIKAIKRKAKLEMAPLIENTVQGYEVLFRYMAMPDASEERALAMRQELLALQEKIAEVRIHTSFQVKQILTESQREKAEARVDRRVRSMDEKREQIEELLLD